MSLVQATKAFLCSIPSSSTGKRQPAEPRDDRHIESEVVPPAGIVSLIDSNIVVKNANNERNWSNPAMPDAGEEICLPLRRILSVAGET